MLKLVTSSTDSRTFDEAFEANRRVANNLSVIAGSIQMRACKELGMNSGNEIRLVPEGIDGGLDAMLDRLLTEKPRVVVDVPGYLRDIAEGIVSSTSLPGWNRLHFAFDHDCFVPPEKALLIGLIVTELVTNAVKYAHPAE
jgi:two-component sensor histidine kinase